MARRAVVVLSRREAAVVRALWLRDGPERVEEMLGVSQTTLTRGAARVPLTPSKAETLRAAISRHDVRGRRPDRL